MRLGDWVIFRIWDPAAGLLSAGAARLPVAASRLAVIASMRMHGRERWRLPRLQPRFISNVLFIASSVLILASWAVTTHRTEVAAEGVREATGYRERILEALHKQREFQVILSGSIEWGRTFGPFEIPKGLPPIKRKLLDSLAAQFNKENESIHLKDYSLQLKRFSEVEWLPDDIRAEVLELDRLRSDTLYEFNRAHQQLLHWRHEIIDAESTTELSGFAEKAAAAIKKHDDLRVNIFFVRHQVSDAPYILIEAADELRAHWRARAAFWRLTASGSYFLGGIGLILSRLIEMKFATPPLKARSNLYAFRVRRAGSGR